MFDHPARTHSFALRRGQSGVALIIALIMLSVILVITGVLLRNSRQQEQESLGSTAAARAQLAVELGLRDAVSRLTATSPNIKPTTPSASWIYPSSPEVLGQPTLPAVNTAGQYSYTYTIRYKTSEAGAISYTTGGSPVFLINAEGRSINSRSATEARRRAELAVVDQYSPAPFGNGLVGCEGVWLASNTRTRSLNSADPTQLFPVSNSKTTPFSNEGGIVALGDNDPVSGKKTVGTVSIGSSSEVRGSIRSEGSVLLGGTQVYGDVQTRNNLTVNSSTAIYGRQWFDSLSGTAKWRGLAEKDPALATWVPEKCDNVGILDATKPFGGEVGRMIDFASKNRNNSLITPGNIVSSKQGNPVISLDGKGKAATVVNLGCTPTPCERNYYLTELTINENVTLNVTGVVNLVVDGPITLTGTGKPSNLKINIGTPGAACPDPCPHTLRIYTTGSAWFNSVDFNYASNARPTSMILYSSAQNTSSEGVVPNSKTAQDSSRIQLNAPNTGVMGLIYAPYSYIWVKTNNSFYGALRGRWVLMDSATTFTYDLAARSIDAAPAGYRIAYWAEQPTDTYGGEQQPFSIGNSKF